MVTGLLLMAGFVLLLAAVVIGAVMVAEAFGKQIIAEEIVLYSLPEALDGFRILFISDIHRRTLPAAMLSSLGHVDAVFLGGDLTERNSPLERLRMNMKLVTSIAPTYAVHGNHDYRADIGKVDDIIHSSGAVLLRDRNTVIEHGGGQLWLTGVDFPATGGKKGYAPLPPLPPGSEGSCRIILVHDPLWLSERGPQPANLILAGHTHGGQVVLPFIGHGHVDNFYRTYNAGWYEWPQVGAAGARAQLLISRGFGTAHLPLRWGSPAEMHVLTLRCPQD
ncbi:metallophosphoesterase [Paenibacillus donghaensis]|uniref:Calcineurin-like phosphoesterase domain-containing protein n=1 Tax=Paenibacillus donghaensis TaxID=414771 RepID=A0A2Z2KBL2_9BACL|nr:metallophosphoesterase [Paenibacillus donghaensis]ASA22947.1 hypothetical protein B9T62_20335 [Paenibacillus donghaensis]